MKFRALSASFLLASLSLLATSTFAQDDFDSEDLEFEDDSAMFEEIPSVFAASKYAQKVTEAPSSITIINAADIKKYGYREMDELMNSVRGFFMTDDRNYDFVNVRGVGLPGDYNSRILLLIDGLRVNENVFSSAALGADFPVDLDLIDRVEIVRGPGSTLYGTNAVFGVVNVITKRGRDYEGVEISAELGSLERNKFRATYGSKLDNGVEILLSASVTDSAGNEKLYYAEFDDPALNNGIAENVDAENAERLFASMSYGDFEFQAAYVNRDKAIPTASFFTEFNADSRTTDSHTYVKAAYSHLFNETTLTTSVAYDKYHYDGHYIYDYADYDFDPLSEPDIVDFQDLGHGEWVTADVQLNRRLGKHTITAGAEYRKDLEARLKSFDIYDLYLDEDNTNNIWAIFVQDDIAITDKFILNLGIRHDDYSSFGGATNPRVAFIYNPSDRSSLKLLHGEAFRAPSAYELYYNDGEFTAKASPNLQPETTISTEFVYEQKLSGNFRAVANVYKNTTDDTIRAFIDPADDLLQFINSGSVDVFGYEFELNGKFSNGRTLSASYTNADAEDSLSGEKLVNSPDSVIKLNFSTPVFNDKTFAGFEVLHLGERMSTFGGTVDSYTIANFNLLSEKIYRDLDLSLGVYNLFDDSYFDSGDESHTQEFIEQNGRTVRFKLAYQF